MRAEDALLKLNLQKAVEQKSEELYKEAKQFGEWAKKAFGDEKSQVRGLENLAYSTRMVCDVFDHIKNQTGKREKWQLPIEVNKEQKSFGVRLLEKLEDLRKETENILNQTLPDKNEHNTSLTRGLHLSLVREFIKHMSSQCIYLQKGVRHG